QQNFARTELGHFYRPFNGVEAGGFAAAVGEDFPAVSFARFRDFFRVDGDHDALANKAVGCGFYKLGVKHRRRVDGDFIGTRVQHDADVVHDANAAADGERNKHFARDFLHGLHGGGAAFVGGGDVEEGDFVGAFVVVALGDFNRVARVANADKVHALNNAAIVDV